MPTSAFISYSHKDAKWLERLNVILTPLTRDGMKVYSDQKIKLGAHWADEIRKALADAKEAILLVGPDFLTSKFIHENELPLLRAEAKRSGLVIHWIPNHVSIRKLTKINDHQAAWELSKPFANLSQAKSNQALVTISATIAEAMNR